MVTSVVLVGALVVAPSPAHAATANPADELALLDVQSERKAGYDRTEWSNSQWNGGLISGDNCDTRCELLAETRRADGTWRSPYDGFVSSDPSDFQIDHVVSVNEAHRSGGYDWSPERKAAFYNARDNGELRVVSATSNLRKSNKGPSVDSKRYWLPSAGAVDTTVTCDFIADWVHIKSVWQLSVDADELQALQNLSKSCGWARSDGTASAAGSAVVSEAESISEIQSAVDFQPADADTLRLYRAFLNRDPDVGGARYWIAQSRAGANPDDLAYGFAQSEEFVSAYGTLTNHQFLTIMYDNMLGREPDLDGFNYWLDLMDNGLAQFAVVRWIVANDEFIDRYPFAPITAVNPVAPVDPAPVDPAPVDPVAPGNPGNSKNCSDFDTQAEAQAWFDRYFDAYGDVANLDADGDGIPCEALP